MRIPEVDVSKILAQTDIVSLIEHYVPLEKKGKEYLGVCPFHDDHSPSMHVSPDKQIYKCFSCGAGGNAYRFLMEIEKISFVEAVQKAAALISYPLAVDASVQAAKPKDPKADLYETMRLFSVYCSYELFSQDGVQALAYLKNRGFTKELIDTYGLGFAPDRSMVRDYLENRIGNRQNLEKTGLIQIGTQDIVPSFYERIMIPLGDPSGKTVGFSARILPGKQGPKYINSTQTELYHKGSLIYNFHNAKDAARKAGRVILAEGAMDVLGLAKAGLKEGVAMLGTALTDEQLDLLSSLSVPVTVFYDQDDAGKHAAWTFAQKAISRGIRFSIVAGAPEKDPDEVFLKHGRQAVLDAIEHTVSYAEFAMDYLQTQFNLANYEDKKQYAKLVEQIIRSSLESFEQSAMFEKLRQITGFTFSALEQGRQSKPYSPRSKKNWNRPHQQLQAPVAIPPVAKGRLHAEKAVLWCMLFHETFCERFISEVGFFSNAACSKLSLYIQHAYRAHSEIDTVALFEQIEEQDVRELLVELSEWPDYADLLPGYFEDALAKIQYDMFTHKIESATRKIAVERDPVQKAKLLQEKSELILNRSRLRKSTARFS